MKTDLDNQRLWFEVVNRFSSFLGLAIERELGKRDLGRRASARDDHARPSKVPEAICLRTPAAYPGRRPCLLRRDSICDEQRQRDFFASGYPIAEDGVYVHVPQTGMRNLPFASSTLALDGELGLSAL